MKTEILAGPKCHVCKEELLPSSEATLCIAGPEVGKFVHWICITPLSWSANRYANGYGRKKQMIEDFERKAKAQLEELKSTSDVRIKREVDRGMAKLKKF